MKGPPRQAGRFDATVAWRGYHPKADPAKGAGASTNTAKQQDDFGCGHLHRGETSRDKPAGGQQGGTIIRHGAIEQAAEKNIAFKTPYDIFVKSEVK